MFLSLFFAKNFKYIFLICKYYLEFEEENLERLKKENPNMRLSQIKQILKKEWQKSPKNPLNKVFL